MNSWFTVTGVNLRVSAPLTYTPAYQRPDGVLIQQRVQIPVAINGVKNKKTGVADVDYYKLMAWGVLADMAAKRCTLGMSLTFTAKPGTYRGNIFYQNVMMLSPDGQPLTKSNIDFTVIRQEFHFGQESAGLIAEEVRTGRRPELWNLQGNAHELLWKEIYTKRNLIRYNGVDAKFGYADVRLPKDGRVVLNPEEFRKTAAVMAARTPASLPAQVSAAFPQAGQATAMAATSAPAAMGTAPGVTDNQSLFGNGGFVSKPANVAGAVGGTRIPF